MCPFLSFAAAFLGPSGSSSFQSLHRDAATSRLLMSINDDVESSLLVSNVHLLGDNGKIQLILASQSPRRREILDMMGLKGRYTHSPSPLDESELQMRLSSQSITAESYTQTLAEEKAKAMADTLTNQEENTLIIGSDTIVDLDGKILEKPGTIDEAKSMLRQLSNRWHKVHTGVSIYHVGPTSNDVSLLSSFTNTAQVSFSHLSSADIDAYVKTGEPMDKAGSYGIQGIGGQLVKEIKGDFFTVMGLPMHRVSRELSRAISQVLIE